MTRIARPPPSSSARPAPRTGDSGSASIGLLLGTTSPPRSGEGFLKWAKQHDIFIHPDVDVLHLTPEMGGFGVFAKKPLKPGTVVISTPLTISISPYSDQHPRLVGLQALASGSPSTIPTPSTGMTTTTNTISNSSSSSSSPTNDAGHPSSSEPTNESLSSSTHMKDSPPPPPLPQERSLPLKKKGPPLPLPRRDPVLAVVLTLLAEYGKGRHSIYFPWLHYCPRMEMHLFELTKEQKAIFGLDSSFTKTTTTICTGKTEEEEKWSSGAGEETITATGATEEALPWTRWTGISQALRDLRLEERWRVAQTEVFPFHPDIWPPHAAQYHLFCLCMAHVYSRNFHREEIAGREGPYLLPGLDFLNHAEPPNTVFEVIGGGRKHERCFTVQVCKKGNGIPAGAQIFASYGQVGSARFVSEFQFLSDDMERWDLCRFSSSQLVEMATELLFFQEQQEKEGQACTRPGATAYARSHPLLLPPAVTVEQVQRKRALFKEIQRRIDLLQRMGLLFDEGLLLKGSGLFRQSLTAEEREAVEKKLKARPFLAVSPSLMGDAATAAASSSDSSCGVEVEVEGGMTTGMTDATTPPAPIPLIDTAGAIENEGTRASDVPPSSSPLGKMGEEPTQLEEQVKGWKRFQVVGYLLLFSSSPKAFDDLYYHQISAHWNPPPLTPATRSLLLSLLGLKLDAVRRVWWEGVNRWWSLPSPPSHVSVYPATSVKTEEKKEKQPAPYVKEKEEEGPSTAPGEKKDTREAHHEDPCETKEGQERNTPAAAATAPTVPTTKTMDATAPNTSHVSFMRSLLYRCLRCEEGVLLQHMMNVLNPSPVLVSRKSGIGSKS